MKRVFTKEMSWNFGALSEPMGIAPVENAVVMWKAQEDILIIGCELHLYSTHYTAQDGYTYCHAEISQVGMYVQDGMIACVAASNWWNSVPGGIHRQNGHVVVMFPDGYAIPIKEEGTVYVNGVCSLEEQSAGIDRYAFRAVIFYVKGKATS